MNFIKQILRNSLSNPLTDRPIYGSVIYLARCSLELRSGTFTAHVFQDLGTHGYIIALAKGDIQRSKVLYTRIHSSCLTSETFRALDSDDIQQLEAAIEKIAAKKNGILFYLIQEGRGAGFIAKARDRMLVQASKNKISTHQAFDLLGLDKDYREYDALPAICHLLKISGEFIVLSNNPDKVEALHLLGLPIRDTAPLEVDPGPHNIAYLSSKVAAGHSLDIARASLLESSKPPKPVIPFQPYALPSASRFIYTASYYLPMKPVDGEILLKRSEWQKIERLSKKFSKHHKKLIKNISLLPENRVLVSIDRTKLKNHKNRFPEDPLNQLLTIPYWFKVHAYYDIASSQEYVALEYGICKKAKHPLIRIQSDSLFNRLPLENVENRDKFKKTVQHVIRYGSGLIILLHNDGRGAGFGAYATDLMLVQLGITDSSEESYEWMGLDYDLRDYEAAASLIRHHVGDKSIRFISSTPDSLTKKPETVQALQRRKIEVVDWVFLDQKL